MTTPAFTITAPFAQTTFRGKAISHPPPPTTRAQIQPRMEASVQPAAQPVVQSPAEPPAPPSSWPPADMTAEWAEAVERLSAAVSGSTLSSADAALQEADGDEMLALRLLTEQNKSDIQRQREQVVEAARASGDTKRVSAMKEAEMRRRATGSAKDFFKGYVEIEGRYVDAGYVDEGADVMGKMMDKVRGLFGK